ERGDLPGMVASPARLRTVLQHLTKTLHPGRTRHPGVLNYCFCRPSSPSARSGPSTGVGSCRY
ncbi:hypothetical protein AB0L10_43785, partial [Streptomyces flaveolus]|uniref:hypothetical protein n=1 Tax=Streptomyces flaveolus TaxID=67297 RepID=UPI0034323F96